MVLLPSECIFLKTTVFLLIFLAFACIILRKRSVSFLCLHSACKNTVLMLLFRPFPCILVQTHSVLATSSSFRVHFFRRNLNFGDVLPFMSVFAIFLAFACIFLRRHYVFTICPYLYAFFMQKHRIGATFSSFSLHFDANAQCSCHVFFLSRAFSAIT